MRPETRDQRPETRDQRPETRDQRPETRDQRPETKRKRNQVRYNLHRLIRKEGYKLKTKTRTIYVYFQDLDFSNNVQRLRDEFGYAIQTELAKQKTNDTRTER